MKDVYIRCRRSYWRFIGYPRMYSCMLVSGCLFLHFISWYFLSLLGSNLGYVFIALGQWSMTYNQSFVWRHTGRGYPIQTTFRLFSTWEQNNNCIWRRIHPHCAFLHVQVMWYHNTCYLRCFRGFGFIFLAGQHNTCYLRCFRGLGFTFLVG